tara:strand:+ start:450 stop:665 length:216 start_codon:yes stop_codon:yes gene_type:complete
MIASVGVDGSGIVILNVPLVQVLLPPKSKTTTNLSESELLYIAPNAAVKVADDHVESAKSTYATADDVVTD